MGERAPFIAEGLNHETLILDDPQKDEATMKSLLDEGLITHPPALEIEEQQVEQIWQLHQDGKLRSEIWAFRLRAGRYSEGQLDRALENDLDEDSSPKNSSGENVQVSSLDLEGKLKRVLANTAQEIHSTVFSSNIRLDEISSDEVFDNWMASMIMAEDDFVSMISSDDYMNLRVRPISKMLRPEAEQTLRKKNIIRISRIFLIVAAGYCMHQHAKLKAQNVLMALMGAIGSLEPSTTALRHVNHAIMKVDKWIIRWLSFSRVERRKNTDYLVETVEQIYLKFKDVD